MPEFKLEIEIFDKTLTALKTRLGELYHQKSLHPDAEPHNSEYIRELVDEIHAVESALNGLNDYVEIYIEG